jgi:hypothetical protein
MDEPEAEARPAKSKKDRGYEAVAMRELRRARRAVEQTPEGGTVPAEASIAVGIANVLALLDVASALRERALGHPDD